MSNHVRRLAVGTLCAVATAAAGCSSGARVSSVTSPRPPAAAASTTTSAGAASTTTSVAATSTQAVAYCQTFIQMEQMESDLAPQGTFAQMSPSQDQAFFSRLNSYLSEAVSEAPPSLRSATQTLADTFLQLSQQLAAQGYNPSADPPAAQHLASAEAGFLDSVRPWLSVHCPAALHPEAPPGGSQLPAGGLHGTLPIPGSSGVASQ